MTEDNSTLSPNIPKRPRTIDVVRKNINKRNAAERRFQLYGKVAIALAISFVFILFFDIINKGKGAFVQSYIALDIYLDEQQIDPDGTRDPAVIADANYFGIIRSNLREMFPEVSSRQERRNLYSLVSSGASYQLADLVREHPEYIGNTFRLWVPADDDIDMLIKGYIDRNIPEDDRRIKDNQIAWIDKLNEEGRVKTQFNTTFFTAGDSRDAELAGILGALSGSFFTLIVTLLLSFPIGVAAAIYLEEFAPQNRLTDIIEVNINNLAAVPSIVFGLLGLAVFINFFALPRSAPLVGGLVLTLMTLPTIIISSRAALKSVPPAIREAAIGLGASKMQMVFNHVLPLALPGMLTGTIIGMAQALGETAPLLMIGMVAFIVDVPSSFTDPSTVLPVQIFLWADSPERAFVEKTSGAIMVLLAFLITMNAVAVFIRKKLERRW